MTTQDRFTKYVMPEPNTGCWLWVGAMMGKYGCFSLKNKAVLAHRVSFELYKGPILKNANVCHSCDNPLCVNPEHLWLGTTQQNTRDRHSKQRDARGESHGMAKLTNDQVIEIKNHKGNHRPMAEKFGITIAVVSIIRRGEGWRHLNP